MVLFMNQTNFECKCHLDDLESFAIGLARTKKLAKLDSAKKVIYMIAHIPDVQNTIMSIVMSSRLNGDNMAHT